MRPALIAAAILIACGSAWAGNGISGAASATINSYLADTKQACPDHADQHCSLKESLLDSSTFYGRFPGDGARYAVVFAAFDSGGSGPDLKAIVWKAAASGKFVLVGSTAAIGGDARDVAFRPGKTIEYTGTVIAPGNVHANPRGHHRFRLVVTSIGVSFLDH